MQKLTTRRLYALGMVMMVAAMPLKAGGCGGDTACLTITKANLAMNNGACPTMEIAQQRIGGMPCTPAKVLGPGALEDGILCCYPVDQPSMVGSCVFGETTGFGSTGDGVPPPGDASVGTGCVGECCPGGGAGGSCSVVDGGLCTSCADLFDGAVVVNLCSSEAGTAFMDLVSCACSGSCAMSCAASFCNGTGADSACRSCLGPGNSGCAGPVSACLAN